MSILQSIFTNPVTAANILETHASITARTKGMTLRQCFAVGNSWDPDKAQGLLKDGTVDKVLAFFATWDYGETEGILKDFKVYNRLEIQNAWHKSRLLKRLEKIDRMSDLLDEDPNDFPMDTILATVRDISLMTDYSNCLMTLKEFLCSQGLQDHYRGIVPNTGPARKAIQALFGCDIISNYAHTEICVEIANETGLSRTAINTALWHLGH